MSCLDWNPVEAVCHTFTLSSCRQSTGWYEGMVVAEGVNGVGIRVKGRTHRWE